MPVCALIGAGSRVLDEVRNGRLDDCAVQILFCHQKAPLTTNSATAIDANELIGHFPDFTLKGEGYEGFHMTWSSLYPLTFSSLASRGLGGLQEDLPVRKLVYDQIKKEVPDALKAFRKMCGV